jgi:hypothetical protein
VGQRKGAIQRERSVERWLAHMYGSGVTQRGRVCHRSTSGSASESSHRLKSSCETQLCTQSWTPASSAGETEMEFVIPVQALARASRRTDWNPGLWALYCHQVILDASVGALA